MELSARARRTIGRLLLVAGVGSWVFLLIAGH